MQLVRKQVVSDTTEKNSYFGLDREAELFGARQVMLCEVNCRLVSDVRLVFCAIDWKAMV